MSNPFLFRLLLVSVLLLAACGKSEAPGVEKSPGADAIEINNRAVGLMGQYQFDQSRALFEGLANQWPDTTAFRVNLAIATLNRQTEGDEQRALELAMEVLQSDSGQLQARYLAGLIELYLGEAEPALDHFAMVAAADEQDAYAAYYLALCHAQLGSYPPALEWYQRAMQLDPYLRSAYYGAFQSLQRLGRSEEAVAVAELYQKLENNPRSQLAEFKYTRMGPKAEALAIDDQASTAVAAAVGALFQPAETLLPNLLSPESWVAESPSGPLSLTTADLQNDGYADLFLTGVMRTESSTTLDDARNLVLTGNPDGSFDIAPDHPLAEVTQVNAALWGDFDNDGLLDVYLCRNGENQLWQQTAANEWHNVTAATGTGAGALNTVDGAFFDADHDGDLDLFLVNSDGPDELLNNNMDGTFRPLAQAYGLDGGNSASTMVLPVDLDNDRDVDLIILKPSLPHEVFLNDRLWSYSKAPGFESFQSQPAVAVLAADLDANGMLELYTLDPEGAVWRWQADESGMMQAENLLLAEGAMGLIPDRMTSSDIDGDGKPDLVLASDQGWAVLSVERDSLKVLYEARLPADAAMPASLAFIGTSRTGPSMLGFSPQNGLTRWQPGSGRHPFITLTLSGRQDSAHPMRSNASGIGTQLAVRAGSNWSRLQTFRNATSPGQSLQAIAVGLNGATQADFVSIDWSDGVFQSELGIPTGELRLLTETQRQLSSCPVLYAWNGEQFAFVSDFLGVGGIGYAIGPGEYSTPRPWENFLLPDGALQPRDQRYTLKIGEPMEEAAYIDAARLAVYDLPAGWQMVMDERMGILGPEPTGEPRFYQHEMLPSAASNDRDEDVLDAILQRDNKAAPVGELDRRFIGMLEKEHVLTLAFSKALDSQAGLPTLVLDGWVEYPYSQTSFAAWQANAVFEAPTLEAFTGDRWHMVYEQFGFPAGMPRRMSLPVADLPPGTTGLRLRTNMQIYWDRIAVAFVQTPPGHSVQHMPIISARLSQAGFARRTTLEQFRPHYDYANLSPYWDTRYMAGHYTRLGPVDELVASADDAVVIIGPGEEVHFEFQAAEEVPAGWQRFFVLEANGWAKDMDLFTRDGETVGPMPSSGKPVAARDGLHERYNTRYQAGY